MVIITAHGAVSVAVEAIKRGASDFVAKPWSNERLAATVRSAAALRREPDRCAIERGRASELVPSVETPLIGKSAALQRVRDLIERAAPTDANVLILGENGTGKEIVAREIHRLSRRSGLPLVSIDLGATTETLFEVRAVRPCQRRVHRRRRRAHRPAQGGRRQHPVPRRGRQPAAAPPAQAADRARAARGAAGRRQQPLPIDVRVVAATNLSAEQLADEKRFRQDLLFRLNTIEIDLPPLRERREDIPVLLDHYLGLYARKYDKPARESRRTCSKRCCATTGRATSARCAMPPSGR